MVSHSVIVAASSPLMGPSPPPSLVGNTTLPPLLTTITRSKRSAAAHKKHHNTIEAPKKVNADLQNLFNIGQKRFDLKDNDRDEFSDIYVRALQAALLGAAKRNRATLCKLESLRSANAKLRAAKVEERVAADKRAAAVKQQQKQA